MLEPFLKFFVVFFVVVDPIALVPVFAGLTEGATAAYRRRMAIKSVLVAAAIIIAFALSGAGFLAKMGISIDSFRIFGGVQAESRRRADISVFPLAFPFMSGPGALTTILLWFGPVSVLQQPLMFATLLAAALAVLAISLLVMLGADRLTRLLGVTGTNVVNRLLGVVLGALAVQFVVDGVRASFGVAAG
jgi:multiple antibiotic resistance protein